MTHQNKEGLESLIGQLRSFAELRHENHEGYEGLIDPTCTEAADALSSLREENERLRRDAWCPDVCPITGRRFFMWIDGEPTYGGPFDSYTIPVRDAEGEYSCRRYDHDEGGWVDWSEGLAIKVVDESDWFGLEDRAETAEAALFSSQAQLKIYREALEAFVNVRDQFPESAKLIDTRFDGHQPISVTVTLDQFRAARTALSQEAGE